MATHPRRCETVEDVCSFLSSRQLPEETVEKFRNQKVDGHVVTLLSEAQLKELGLEAVGDRLRLRELCNADSMSIRSYSNVERDETSTPTINIRHERLGRRREILDMLGHSSDSSVSTRNVEGEKISMPDTDIRRERQGRRREIIEMLRGSATVRGRSSDPSISKRNGGRPKKCTRSCTFGVKLNSDKRNDDGDRIGVIVKSPLGDKNNVSVQVPIQDDYYKLLNLVNEIFFPSGYNSVIGKLDNFSTEIVNFRNQNLRDNVTGVFSLENYIDQKRIPGTPKFYLFCSSLEDEILDSTELVESTLPVESDTTSTYTPGTPSCEVLLRIPEPEGSMDEDTGVSELGEVKPQDEAPKWSTISDCIKDTIKEMEQSSDPVEVLKYYEQAMHQGRALESSETETPEGETLSIFVSRYNLWESGMEELLTLENPNYRLPLDVTFYGELAQDLGGPRREFLSLMMKELLKEEHHLVRKTEQSDQYMLEETSQNLRKKYYFGAGLLAGMSMLQQGPMPAFLEESQVNRLVEGHGLSPSEEQFRDGLNCLGIVELIQGKPCLQFLLRSTAQKDLNHKQILHLLKPQFSDPGSNARQSEELTYSRFVCYLKEVAAGRRGCITLGSVLRFVTGTEFEPILGFENQPTIHFSKWLPMSLPKAQTCILQLTLPIGADVPTEKENFFQILDLAFVNTFFGVM